MDVKELMAFKPSQTPKRPAMGESSREGQDEMVEDDPSDSYDARAKKRKLAMKKAQEVCVDIIIFLTNNHSSRICNSSLSQLERSQFFSGNTSSKLNNKNRTKFHLIHHPANVFDSNNCNFCAL